MKKIFNLILFISLIFLPLKAVRDDSKHGVDINRLGNFKIEDDSLKIINNGNGTFSLVFNYYFVPKFTNCGLGKADIKLQENLAKTFKMGRRRPFEDIVLALDKNNLLWLIRFNLGEKAFSEIFQNFLNTFKIFENSFLPSDLENGMILEEGIENLNISYKKDSQDLPKKIFFTEDKEKVKQDLFCIYTFLTQSYAGIYNLEK